ncbi:MAG: 7-carboxy-7-deazaguanine synthase QueE [Gammaproteobacteria bacterium]|nr:7-carboxy-7-deazaguanine synthase QueE [Gammaproteobacteria bacterium]
MLKPVQYDTQADSLRITEIFHSLQGESRTVGLPTVFIRLTGCPLRCNYCDSEYAFSGGQDMGVDEVLEQVARYAPRYVCVTGGEPLAQKGCLNLLGRLIDAGYEVSLETSGALDVSQVDPRVVKVMDLKTPSSTECEKNLWHNLEFLNSTDQVKFVIASRSDYIWSRDIVSKHQLGNRCEVLFSPVYGELKPADLAQWILEDGLNVRFQLQLHKLLWGEEPGR